jgi:hypothetical protein
MVCINQVSGRRRSTYMSKGLQMYKKKRDNIRSLIQTLLLSLLLLLRFAMRMRNFQNQRSDVKMLEIMLKPQKEVQWIDDCFHISLELLQFLSSIAAYTPHCMAILFM